MKDALTALKNGGFVILVDSADRENEGDLVLAAEFATPEKLNFLIHKACGLVCLALPPERIDALGLSPMVTDNRTPRKTAFTVSIEARDGVSTGISAADRAHTICVAADPSSGPESLVSPGHVFPLRARAGGVLERPGHTEGAIELCQLAGLNPAAVICEIMNEDGTMARKHDLKAFAEMHEIPVVTIEELIQIRVKQGASVIGSGRVPFFSRYAPGDSGLFVEAFRVAHNTAEHAVVSTPGFSSAPWVRIHSECLTGDVLGSDRCDCGEQLQESLRWIQASGDGIVIYLKNHEGRGIGLWNKVQAYGLQDKGLDTVEANLALGFAADLRDYRDAAAILHQLNVKNIRLLTQNPTKKNALERFGISVQEVVSPKVNIKARARAYLAAKKEKLGHWVHDA
jgi:3,4-dihydroxy 2-butanone 4-phosphate synthase / GTP cyclohydrolase II